METKDIRRIARHINRARPIEPGNSDLQRLFSELLMDAYSRLDEYICLVTFAPDNITDVIGWFGEPIVANISVGQQFFLAFLDYIESQDKLTASDVSTFVDYLGVMLALIDMRNTSLLVLLEKANHVFA